MESLNLKCPTNAICRTCMKPARKLTDIFSRIDDRRTAKEMLMYSTGIEVEINDGLPKNLCRACLKTLTSACNFKTMAIDCNLKLHHFHPAISSNKVKIVEIETVFIEDEIKVEPCTLEGKEVVKIKSDEADVAVGNLGTNAENVAVKKEDNSTMDSENSITSSKNDKNSELFNDSQDQISSTSPRKEIQPDSTSWNVSDDEDIGFGDAGNEEREKQTFSNNTLCKPEYHLKKTGLKSRDRYKQSVLCEFCNKSFSFRYYANIHIHQHMGNAPHKCDKCDKRFPKLSLLNKHKQLHSDTKSYECNVCGKMFICANNLYRHKRIHSEQKPYKCDICNKAFKIPECLKEHKRTHSTERPFVCEICGKSFIASQRLYIHTFIHKTSKSFTCPECGKILTNKISLQRHIRRHSSLKTYACDRCDKSFSSNALLRHHIFIHTGEKPYACKVCGKTFRQRGCIARHMRTHTGETPYSCEQCPSKFKYTQHLLNHMKTHA